MLRFHDGKELLGNLLGTADAALFGCATQLQYHRRMERLRRSNQARTERSSRRARWSSAGRTAARSSVSGSRRHCAMLPAKACAPGCIFLLTMRKCWPVCVAVISIFATDGQWVGSREVRKAKPWSSPLTRKLPRVPQTLWTLKGMRRMVQPPNLFCRRSSVALKDFATGLGVVFFFMGVAERKNFNTRS